MIGRARIKGITPILPLPPGFYGWGYNYDGQLAVGDNATKTLPEQVGSATDWTPARLSGSAAGYGIRSGKLYSWGSNYNGELGTGEDWSAAYSSPVQIGSLSTWTFVTAGGGASYSAFGVRAGRLYSWGQNYYGQLGHSDYDSKSLPVQVGALTDWESAALGEYHSLALRVGQIYASGYNSYGQLGLDGSYYYLTSFVQIGADTDWEMVAAQGSNSYGIRAGKLFAWGNAEYGQLGDGTVDYDPHSSPIQVGSETDWDFVAAGYWCAFGIRAGKLFAWGANGYGQLGLGDTDPRSSPVQVGSETDWSYVSVGNLSCYGLRAGKLFVWGWNDQSQLGLGDTNPRSSPVQIGADSDWTAVGAGDNYVHATRST